MSLFAKIVLAALLLLVATVAVALSGRPHADPIAPVILGVTGILFFAILGRFAARKLGQPSVLGELLMGVGLGTIGYLFGVDFLLVLREGPAIFEIFEMSLTSGSVDQAAVAALGPEDATIILSILHGPGGAELTQVAHTQSMCSPVTVSFSCCSWSALKPASKKCRKSERSH